MIREPAEIVVREDGSVERPMGLLVEAGLSVGARLTPTVMATGGSSCEGEADALDDLINGRPL